MGKKIETIRAAQLFRDICAPCWYNGGKHRKRGVNMEYRELGRTGLRVSRLGFGGIPIQRID